LVAAAMPNEATVGNSPRCSGMSDAKPSTLRDRFAHRAEPPMPLARVWAFLLALGIGWSGPHGTIFRLLRYMAARH
jgi:hypothetical protein